MQRRDLEDRLSRISTMWSVMREAHQGPPDAARIAQELLLERYGKAVRRYLMAALRDADAVEELAQEFAICLLKGEFRHASPEKGRFRNYVKTVLFHLVSKYRGRQRKSPRPLAGDSPIMQAVAAPEADDDFDKAWRDELLARTWDALAGSQSVYFEVLKFRAAHPNMPSATMAAELSQQLGKSLTADGVRQTLSRAREKFADLLLDEVAHSIEPPNVERVEEELQELNLLEYCRPAYDRYRSN